MFGFLKKKKKDGADPKRPADGAGPTVPPPVSKNSRNTSKQKKNKKEDRKTRKGRGKGNEKNTTKGKGSKKKAPVKPAGEPEEALTTSEQSKRINKPVRIVKRAKKGKKPQYKKIPREKLPRKVGKVQRVKNKFYPGDANFAYSSPPEVWLSCLGRNTQVDFGNKARMMRDPTDE